MRLWDCALDFYVAHTGADDATVVAQMKSICDEFETMAIGVLTLSFHRGLVVNARRSAG
jgi:hypothetical protein